MITPVVYAKIPASDPVLVAEAATHGISDLHEALGAGIGRAVFMQPGMRPLDSLQPRIAGPAVTAYSYPGDNLMMHTALRIAAAGQVLVLTNGGGIQGALWGELAAIHARDKGIAGVIVEGSIRDSDVLAEMKFPIWCTAISPGHSEKRMAGAVNVPIVCGGVLVNPGDIIVADSDGVIAIPRRHLRMAVEGARGRKVKEDELKRRLAAGESLFDLLSVAASLEAAGMVMRETTWLEDETSQG